MQEVKKWENETKPKMERVFYILRYEDVGERYLILKIDGKREMVMLRDCIGYVQAADVGKKLVRTEGGNSWQLENDEQFLARKVGASD